MGQAGLKAQPSFLRFPRTDTCYKHTQYAQLLTPMDLCICETQPDFEKKGNDLGIRRLDPEVL